MNCFMKETHFFWHISKMALGQSFSFGVFLITITSFFHLDFPKYLESKKFPNESSNSQCDKDLKKASAWREEMREKAKVDFDGNQKTLPSFDIGANVTANIPEPNGGIVEEPLLQILVIELIRSK